MRWIRGASAAKEAQVAKRLRPSSKFYRFLWEIRDELFDDEFEESLIASYAPRGQVPCPPAQLAMVVLLQRYEGLSDARAVDAAENDRRWQLVLGTLGSDEAPFGQGTLFRFRSRMIADDLDRRLLDRTVELAKRTGSFGWKKLRAALDSSPLEGAGRVEDTWNLIGRAMTKVVCAVSAVLDIEESEVVSSAKLSLLEASSIKAGLDIDWNDPVARQEALRQLLAQVCRLEKWVARRAGQPAQQARLKEALELLRRIVDQDTEPDPDGSGPRIKPEVSPDRIISVSDPEMRHGRKSKSKVINGYKRHIAIANGFILSTAIKPANVREHEAAPSLLVDTERHGDLETLDIDRGYIASKAVERLHQRGVVINSRTWSQHTDRFPKAAFRIDLRRRKVTCPAGRMARIRPSGKVEFDVADCSTCKLKPRCTKATNRCITLHRQEDLHIKLRARAKTRPGRRQLRERVQVEHRLARIAALQGRKARYRGVRKNEFDLNRAAAVANLQQVAFLAEISGSAL